MAGLVTSRRRLKRPLVYAAMRAVALTAEDGDKTALRKAARALLKDDPMKFLLTMAGMERVLFGRAPPSKVGTGNEDAEMMDRLCGGESERA